MVQVGLLAVLFLLFLQMEQLAKYDERAQELVGRLNFLESRLASSAVAVLAFETSKEERTKQLNLFRKQALNELSELYLLCLSDPGEAKEFSQLNTVSLRILQTLASILQQSQPDASVEDKVQKYLWNDFALARRRLLADERLRFENDVHFIFGWKPHRQTVESVLLLFIVLNIALAALLVRNIGANIQSRIATLMENSQRLPADQPLLPPVTGEDEIARLDAAFREMSLRLKQAKDTERLLLRSAVDLICMIDESGNFIKSNPAAVQVLNCSEQEIKSKNIADFLSSENHADLAEKLGAAKDEGSDKTLDITMQRHNGETVETSWSIRHIPEESAFFCTIRDISERAALEQMKQDITRMVNHDIRSPLTTIQGVFDILEHPGMFGENPKAMSLLERGRLSCQMVLNLTKELLDMDRLESGSLQIEKALASLNDIFMQAKEAVHGISEKKSVGIKVVASDLEVFVDADRIVQVLTNLLTNAIKFSPKDSEVIISADVDEKHIEIRVKDQGRGIPSDILPHIFDKFRQVAAADGTKHGGSGLGLSICKSLIELHGGTITCQSEVGAGSIFKVRLPYECSGDRSSQD